MNKINCKLKLQMTMNFDVKGNMGRFHLSRQFSVNCMLAFIL